MAARTPVSARLTDEEVRLIRKRDRERTEVLAVADRHVLLRHMDAVDAEPEGLTDEALAEIQSRVDRATGQAWHWAGNIDTGEPYLATWLPGWGRCQIFSIGHETRTVDDARSQEYREDLRSEEGLTDEDEIHERVLDSITDENGNYVTVPRLWFYGDGVAAPAREQVVFEVAPEATSREDPKVYRADIVDIRHPDAQFIAHSREDVEALLNEVHRLKALLPVRP